MTDMTQVLRKPTMGESSSDDADLQTVREATRKSKRKAKKKDKKESSSVPSTPKTPKSTKSKKISTPKMPKAQIPVPEKVYLFFILFVAQHYDS